MSPVRARGERAAPGGMCELGKERTGQLLAYVVVSNRCASPEACVTIMRGLVRHALGSANDGIEKEQVSECRAESAQEKLNFSKGEWCLDHVTRSLADPPAKRRLARGSAEETHELKPRRPPPVGQLPGPERAWRT